MWPSMCTDVRTMWTTLAPWPSQNLLCRSVSNSPTLNTGFEESTNSPYYWIIRTDVTKQACTVDHYSSMAKSNLSARSVSSRPTLNTGFEDTTNSPYYCIILYVRMWPSMRTLWTTKAPWQSQNLSSRSVSNRPTLNTGVEDITNSPYHKEPPHCYARLVPSVFT